MAQETFKVCLAGTSNPVEGTSPEMTEEQVVNWLAENQVYYEENDPEKPLTDLSKYVVLPSNMD